MIFWVLKYWRLLAIGGAVIGIISFIGYIYYKGGSDREDKLVSEAIEKRIEERDRLDEIRNAPVDVDDVIKRLRSRTF